jgi:hypothetical protein
LKRPKPVVKCPWKAARRRRRLRAIERLVRHLPADEVALYVDEVDVHLNPKIGLDWIRRGRQKEVLTPGCNQKCYLAGAWNPKRRRLTYVERIAELEAEVKYWPEKHRELSERKNREGP